MNGARLLQLEYRPHAGAWAKVVDSLACDGPTPPKGMDHHTLVMLGDRMELYGYTLAPYAAGGWIARVGGTETVCPTLEALETFVDGLAAESALEARRRYARDRYAKSRKKRPDERTAELKGEFMDAMARALAGFTVRQAGGAS
ncbi:hypothetical protein KIH07_18530 [Hydrogenophaga taeniospiralis]|uniref:hypothetical protein n=1 Tax=Hydrogenophaga taeniospiralis TaxID=65656 RepID=UPI001CFA4D18|nr:hypothetical protein [Hydrogenophaga taeniospiralis]MCB4365737.1 hypothetical protein [Hydrogenophaga taeniospiralis]